MIKTKEYEGTVQWAKDAPLTVLVDAITENRRYPSVIRDELRARLKGTPGLTVSDLLWEHFMRVSRGRESPEHEAAAEAPGAFLIPLRDNREFWLWANFKGYKAFINGAETMWKKCFDKRLTDTPREGLTDGELGLIRAFENALRDYNIDNERNFAFFLNDNSKD